MKNIISKYLILACSALVMLSGCRKDDFEGTETGNSGTTFVSVGTTLNQIYFTPFNEVRKVDLVTVRRDAANNAELQKDVTVTLTSLPDAITKYNTNNETDFEELPESIFTMASDPGVSSSANGYTFQFKAGEFEKKLSINLDGSKWDLSKKYAKAFLVTDASGVKVKSSSSDTLYVLISIKNKYDGVYEITGTLTDANALYHGDYGDPEAPRTYSLTTASTSSVTFYDLSWDYPNYIVLSNATNGGANTGISPIYTFDPATDALVSVTDANNPARVFTNVAGQFNAGDRSIKIHWTAGRWTVDETFEFKHER